MDSVLNRWICIQGHCYSALTDKQECGHAIWIFENDQAIENFCWMYFYMVQVKQKWSFVVAQQSMQHANEPEIGEIPESS